MTPLLRNWPRSLTQRELQAERLNQIAEETKFRTLAGSFSPAEPTDADACDTRSFPLRETELQPPVAQQGREIPRNVDYSSLHQILLPVGLFYARRCAPGATRRRWWWGPFVGIPARPDRAMLAISGCWRRSSPWSWSNRTGAQRRAGDGGPVSAKPRVHEIASAMGVDVKVVLRMLKDDGEFIKGPSSSVEPPVARRIRSRLAAKGYVEQSPKPAAPGMRTAISHPTTPPPVSSATHPVPAPPGTRWRATEPFIAYAKPAPPPPTPAEVAQAKRVIRAARTAQQAADEALQAVRKARHDADAGARAETAERLEAAKRKALRLAAAAVAKRADEKAAKSPASIGLNEARAKETATRAEEIARKGRAKTAVEIADRIERDARRERAAPRLVTEDEARAAARKAVVARSDARWEYYGFGKGERQRWEMAGLRRDQAHIPAMCRAFSAPGWNVTPNHLKVVLSNGRTVQAEFEAGSNIVQVMDQLAAVRRREFSGSYNSSVTAVIPALRDLAPEKLAVTVPLSHDLGATGVPRIADHILLLTRPSQDERMIDAFNRERHATERARRPGQRGADRPGHLVKLYAEAHGVFGDVGLTRELLDNLPLHVIKRRLPFKNLINDALRERQFYYLSAGAALTVMSEIDSRIPIPEDYELPSTTGLAVLEHVDQSGHSAGSVLLWSHGAGELTAVILEVAELRAGLVKRPLVSSASAGSVLGANGDVALALVGAIAAVMRRPASADAAGQVTSSGQLRGAGSPSRPMNRPTTKVGEPADHVSVIYAPGEARAEGVPNASGRKATKRWMVSGHYRQQLFPSLGERHPVWIKRHESGAAGGDLWVKDRVKVPRQVVVRGPGA